MKCPACGKDVRKTKLALVLRAHEPPKGRRVCLRCFEDGMTVVTPVIAPIVDAAKAERRAQREVLSPFIRNLEARLRARKSFLPSADGYQIGYLRALEDVVAILKEGRA